MAARDNIRPSWFHARDYGLIVANPFGRKALTKGDESRIVVPRGEAFRLRFAVYLHGGADKPDDDIALVYREFFPWSD
jgi:hypothetical protein